MGVARFETELRGTEDVTKAVEQAAKSLDGLTKAQERAQKQITAIINKGEPQKALMGQAAHELKIVNDLLKKEMIAKEKAEEAKLAIVKRYKAQILEEEKRAAAQVATITKAGTAATVESGKALQQLKPALGDVGQLANSVAGSFGAAGQKATQFAQGLVGSLGSGGPIALAIGGTIGLLTLWKSELDDIKKYVGEAAAAAAAAQREYNDTLDKTLSNLREEKELRNWEAAGGSKKSLDLLRTMQGAANTDGTTGKALSEIDAKIAAERAQLADFVAQPDSVVTGMNEAGRESRRRVSAKVISDLEAQRAVIQAQLDKERAVVHEAAEAYAAEVARLEAERAKALGLKPPPEARSRGGRGGRAASVSDGPAIELDTANEAAMGRMSWGDIERGAADFDKDQARAAADAERARVAKGRALGDSLGAAAAETAQLEDAIRSQVEAQEAEFAALGGQIGSSIGAGLKSFFETGKTEDLFKGLLGTGLSVASSFLLGPLGGLLGGGAMGGGAASGIFGLLGGILGFREGGVPMARGGLTLDGMTADTTLVGVHPREPIIRQEMADAYPGGLPRLARVARGEEGWASGGGGGRAVNVYLPSLHPAGAAEALRTFVAPAQVATFRNKQSDLLTTHMQRAIVAPSRD